MHDRPGLLSVLSAAAAVTMLLTACSGQNTDAGRAVPAPPEVSHSASLFPEDDLLPAPEPDLEEESPAPAPSDAGTPDAEPTAPTDPAPLPPSPPTVEHSAPQEHSSQQPPVPGPAPVPVPAPAPTAHEPAPVPTPAPIPEDPAPAPTTPPSAPTPADPPPSPAPAPSAPAQVPVGPSLEAFLEASGLTEAHARGEVPVVSSVAEARSLTNAAEHVVVSDGTSHVVFDKGAASEVTQTFGGESYGARFQDSVELIAWDIPADAGDTLNSAAALAATQGKPLALAPSQTYSYSGTVKLPRNMKGIEGRGATLTPTGKGDAKRPVAALQLETQSSDMSLRDFTLDMGDTTFGIGILGNSVKDVSIQRVNIDRANHRGIQFSASVSDVENIRIEDSRIDNVTGDAHNKGVVNSIVIEAAQEKETTYNLTSPYWDRYTHTGSINPQRLHARNIQIRNNNISGGYYGISFSGVSQSTISGNTITMNMRNISMQNNSSGNTVESNQLLEGGSSGVTIGYNSDDNVLRNNTVVSGRASRQALLQAYQASDNNQFLNNSITITGDGNPQWMMYAGTDSHGTVFSGNTLKGRARKAAIGVESVWDGASILSRGNNPYSYMSSGYIQSPVDNKKVTYNGGFGPLRGVTITGNSFQTTNGSAPLVYVGADVSRGRTGDRRIIGDVTDLTVSGNTASGAYSEKVIVHEGTIDGVGEAKVHFKDSSFGP